MQAHQLKMNPIKSFLGVPSGKFLQFVVTSKGIHLDPQKICAIQEMLPLRNLKKHRGLQGCLAYIPRFIAKSLKTLPVIHQVMEKGVSFIWDITCQQMFEKIKQYLMCSPVLAVPVSGKPFLIYIRAMDHFLGALLAQNNDQRYEQAIYQLSRTMIRAEHHYNRSKRSVWLQSSPYKGCDIIWQASSFMSSPKSIL